ncbi:MAG: YchF family ATPase [Acidobacteria bacterium]|nr:YchF family ATPase [Acidobacteriota bacterium]
MKLGIFGFPQVGKTSLFNLLTGTVAAARRADPNVGVARVPDPRLDRLSGMFHPRKTTAATFECVDIVGLHRGEAASSLNLAVLKPVDALAHVVRGFEDAALAHSEGSIDAARDVENMDMELIFADLDTVTKRVDRLKQNLAKMARGLTGLEGKPQVAALAVSLRIEMEMSQLPEKDAAAFRADLGIAESALARVLRGAFDLLGLVSFYTVGEDECRAWPLRRGSPAVKAAGAIHTDIEKGFIRAEVTAYDRFLEAGSFPVARDRGWFRLEGKEYVVLDGDIVHFRFAN